MDHWRGSAVEAGAFARSSLYHAMAGGQLLRLTTCRRADEELFAFYSSCVSTGWRFAQDLQQTLRDGRERYYFDGPARHNLCISHKHRRRLNKDVGKAFAPLEAKLLQASSPTEESLLVWRGCPLLGASISQRCAVQNNVEYLVEEVGDGYLILQGGKKITFALALQAMRPAWARTYASV